MTEAAKLQSRRSWIRIASTALVCLAILGASGAAIVLINRTEPTAKQVNATRKSAALVETVTAGRGTYAPNLVVLGTVEPARDVILSPRVSGQIIEISPKFVPGGMVREGDLLLRIDPADFENALSTSLSELEQAEASLEIEQGRQTLAKKELALLEGTIDDTNRALVLRQPQIESVRAEVNAAEASVQRAELDLRRTRVTAPFDAQLIRCSVNVGSQVASGDELARLVGVEQYWLMASVPVRSLHWIRFPELDGRGSPVTLRNPDTWPAGAERHGQVARMIGTLDDETRMARLLVTVSDPLARKTDGPPLILGSLIETHIEGRPIHDVIRLSRDYVRERDTVWVMNDGKLEIREVDVVFRDADDAYIRDGLRDGEQVVTTTLATVAEGVGLRKAEDISDQAGGPSDSSEPLDEETVD